MALKLGHAVSNFALELGGKTAGYLSSFQAPSYEADVVEQGLGPDWVSKKMIGGAKISEATATFNIGSCQHLLDWVASVWQKNCQEMDAAVMLADQNYKVKRRIDMMGCLISGIEFPAFDAKDGKKHLEVTCKWKPERITYAKAGGETLQSELSKKAKNWMVNNFMVTIPGIDCQYVTKFEPSKLTPKIADEAHGAFRLPTRHYAAIDISSIKVEFAGPAFDQVKDMAVKVIQDGIIKEEEYLDITVDMYDQSMKNVLGTFTFIGCGMKKFDWSPKLEGGKEGMATCTAEWVVEEFNFVGKHMG